MNTSANLEAIQAMLASERFLDEPVGEYRIKTTGTKLDLGTAAALRQYYKGNLQEAPGKIKIGSAVITTTPEVLAVLRALLYVGCCRIEARSTACREVFMRACRAGPHVGQEELIATFEEAPSNPFVKVLQDTILELLRDR